jgi:hypothetical protein
MNGSQGSRQLKNRPENRLADNEQLVRSCRADRLIQRARGGCTPWKPTPVGGEERQAFIRQAEPDFMDYWIIADSEATLEAGILTLRVDLNPPEKDGSN